MIRFILRAYKTEKARERLAWLKMRAYRADGYAASHFTRHGREYWTAAATDYRAAIDQIKTEYKIS